jgi:hypothetical protein
MQKVVSNSMMSLAEVDINNVYEYQSLLARYNELEATNQELRSSILD